MNRSLLDADVIAGLKHIWPLVTGSSITPAADQTGWPLKLYELPGFPEVLAGCWGWLDGAGGYQFSLDRYISVSVEIHSMGCMVSRYCRYSALTTLFIRPDAGGVGYAAAKACNGCRAQPTTLTGTTAGRLIDGRTDESRHQALLFCDSVAILLHRRRGTDYCRRAATRGRESITSILLLLAWQPGAGGTGTGAAGYP